MSVLGRARGESFVKREKSMDEEQKKLHVAMVAELSGMFAQKVGDMTLGTAIEVATNFYVATMVHLFHSTGKLGELKGKVVGDEVSRRINELKRLQWTKK